jgi:aspartate kinase
MTADPRLVPDAVVLDEVTYNEAAELAYNGAKVLHPRTLAPLVAKGIPVWSKNSFNLTAPGTRIVPTTRHVPPGPRAVTSMANVALVSVDVAKPAVNGTAIMGRALDALAGVGSEVLAFSSSSYRQNFCFLIRKDELDEALDSLEQEFQLELEHDYLQPIHVDSEVGLLAVVGEGMQGTPGLAGRIFTAISRENVNIIAIAQGSSELTIVIVVARSGLDKAVQAVHAECSLGQMAEASRVTR